MPKHDHVCPWCQTEIVWDPEIGPEDVCPHCFNELGDYRSVALNENEQYPFDREDTVDVELDDYDDGVDTFDEYEEGVQRVLDTQEEAPGCTICQSLMLFAGSRTMALGFVPLIPDPLKQPLLNAAHTMKVFVCPSCFKIEHVLADDDRLAMIELIKEHGRK